MGRDVVARRRSLHRSPFRNPVEDAARVVVLPFADQDDRGVLRESLREASCLSAHCADGGEHHDAVGDREECGAWAGEWITGEGLIQDDEDDAPAGFTKPPDEADKLVVEELRFIDPDNLDVVRDELSHLSDGVDGVCHESAATVACDLHRIIAPAIIGVLEHDELLLGVLCAAQTSDELLGFSAEHAAGDGVDRTEVLAGVMCRGHEHFLGERIHSRRSERR